jgi:hypothetical protein
VTVKKKKKKKKKTYQQKVNLAAKGAVDALDTFLRSDRYIECAHSYYRIYTVKLHLCTI